MMQAILYLGFAILVIFISRAIFSIGTIVKNLKMQSDLLLIIAEKLGASQNDINRATITLKTPGEQLESDLSNKVS